MENQKPKIVPTPQTELDKALKIKIVGSKKQRKKETKLLMQQRVKRKMNVCVKENSGTK